MEKGEEKGRGETDTWRREEGDTPETLYHSCTYSSSIDEPRRPHSLPFDVRYCVAPMVNQSDYPF